MKYTIKHPEWLTVTDEKGSAIMGYNQDWYPEKRQQLAGCGPTVGAMMAAYMEHKEWNTATPTKEGALAHMLDIWKYATPRMHGLYKTGWLKDGLSRYMADHGLTGTVEALPIPSIHLLAPKYEKVRDFIQGGLSADMPVGFLNLHSGVESIPYHWHWMPVVALEEKDGTSLVTLWDEGKAHTFNLASWLKTTRFGGGFVRVLGTGKEMA